MTERPPAKPKPADEAPANAIPSQSGGKMLISRRSLLIAGVGLYAVACAPGEKAPDEVKEEVERQIGEIARRIREGRKVLGRVADGPLKKSDSFAVAAAGEFPQPAEMNIEADGVEKSLTLDVDYLDLEIAKRDGEILSGRVRAYNGSVPGPTIRCQASDQLSITLNNNLPQEEFTYDYMGCKTVDGGLSAMDAGLPHAFNYTNLHTHGLHVSPQSLCGEEVCPSPPTNDKPTLASDDVFVTLAPGESQQYCIVLPDFHAPGTHWYHAHKHGSTAIQVNNGLVGALIVEEQGDDRILGDQPHEDLIFLMQEIMEVDNGNDQLVYAQATGDSSKFFINGEYQPRQTMKTGEIQRWRFINGTSRPRGLTKLRLVKLGLEPLIDTSDLELPGEHGKGLEGANVAFEQMAIDHPELYERILQFQKVAEAGAQPMNAIAVDGISFYGKPPKTVTEWDFAPGNRVDFLVQVSEPGTYTIVKDIHDQSGGRSPETQILAYVEVTAGDAPMTMPTVIPGNPPCYLDPIYDYEYDKTVDFQAQSSTNWSPTCPEPAPWVCAAGEELICNGETRSCNPSPPDPPLLPRIFAIDCERFDEDEVEPKYTIEINSVEEWTLRNHSGGAHPFHIHVNPFQVVEIFDPNANNGQGETQTFGADEALWQDVVALPLANGSTPGHVKIRHRFLNYVGDYVIHCHFLNHEDMGMMKRVQVVPSSSASGTPPCQPLATCSKG